MSDPPHAEPSKIPQNLANSCASGLRHGLEPRFLTVGMTSSRPSSLVTVQAGSIARAGGMLNAHARRRARFRQANIGRWRQSNAPQRSATKRWRARQRWKLVGGRDRKSDSFSVRDPLDRSGRGHARRQMHSRNRFHVPWREMLHSAPSILRIVRACRLFRRRDGGKWRSLRHRHGGKRWSCADSLYEAAVRPRSIVLVDFLETRFQAPQIKE
jgi:hypothetical protein